jgi:hypothetical protein
MPNCFALIRKSEPQAGRVEFAKIDEEMRKHFKIEPDSDKYLLGWYRWVGFALACGKTFTQLKEQMFKQLPEGDPSETDTDRLAIKIVDWLDANFTSDAWYQHK